MFGWLRDLFTGGTRNYQIGDRVYLKNDVRSAKNPDRQVYIIDDIKTSRIGGWYDLHLERHPILTLAGPITDSDLEPVIQSSAPIARNDK